MRTPVIFALLSNFLQALLRSTNVYGDANAFYKQYDWRREPTVNSRETDGRIRLTSEQRNHFELVSGTHGQSGEQIDIWSAVFGPLGRDGYFEPLFNKLTGEMNPRVAQYWKENFDLLEYLKKKLDSHGSEDRRQDSRLYRHDGYLRAEQLYSGTREVDEDDRKSALRGLLSLRRSQAALLVRTRNPCREA